MHSLLQVIQFPVGILQPDWLASATLEGTEDVDGFHCNRWEKADFITYWTDTISGLPVKWIFHIDGAVFHVLTFTANEQFPIKQLQAPSYCFSNSEIDVE